MQNCKTASNEKKCLQNQRAVQAQQGRTRYVLPKIGDRWAGKNCRTFNWTFNSADVEPTANYRAL
jgi:hypothetical protein